MENYFKVNPIEKLYLYQKEEFENQIVNIDTAFKKAEIEKMIIDYELAKLKYEDMMYFWYYKLGFNDSSKLYK